MSLCLGCDMCIEHKCIYGCLHSANILAILEPPGLIRETGKLHNGLTLIHWNAGKMMICDTTVSDTLASSYLKNLNRRSPCERVFYTKNQYCHTTVKCCLLYGDVRRKIKTRRIFFIIK